MSRINTSVRLLAAALVSVTLLTGMSCGAGGFSIPLAEQTDEQNAGDDPWQAGDEGNEEGALRGER
ncbi:MAG: hypothetical protein OXI90_13440 [Gammaproteobacteria bacterium]|nr:hypothetical protein [Gammaproteobacteria bacterium]